MRLRCGRCGAEHEYAMLPGLSGFKCPNCGYLVRWPTKARCVFQFGDKACGIEIGNHVALHGDHGSCNKTIEDCRRHQNEARFGGFPRPFQPCPADHLRVTLSFNEEAAHALELLGGGKSGTARLVRGLLADRWREDHPGTDNPFEEPLSVAEIRGDDA